MIKTINLWWAKFHELRDLLRAATIANGAIDPALLMKAREILAKILHDGNASGNFIYKVCDNEHKILIFLDSPQSVRNYFALLSEEEISGNENDSYMEVRKDGKRLYYSARHTVERF